MNIAFIGGGNMARSLIGGLVDSGFSADCIVVSDPVTGVGESLNRDFAVSHTASNTEALAKSHVAVMAVKPQQMNHVITEMAGHFEDKLLISIAAGVLTDDMVKWTKQDQTAVVRCMPNTPALLRAGATALFANKHVSETQRDYAKTILSAVGAIAWVDNESQLDAITALSGSGPAYFFLLLESMIEAAVELDLPEDLATRFAIQTALGAARMADEGDAVPAKLRENVTSPAGTTEAALKSFAADKFRKTVARAMNAAASRATELGKELGEVK